MFWTWTTSYLSEYISAKFLLYLTQHNTQHNWELSWRVYHIGILKAVLIIIQHYNNNHHHHHHWSESQFFPWQTFISMRSVLTTCETIRAGSQSSNPWHKSQHNASSSGHKEAFQDSSSCRRPFSKSICRDVGNFWLSDIKAFCNL